MSEPIICTDCGNILPNFFHIPCGECGWAPPPTQALIDLMASPREARTPDPEITRLRADLAVAVEGLEMIGRMKIMPDSKINLTTLSFALRISRDTLSKLKVNQ